MKIKTLTFSGLKGTTARLEFDGVNVIAGANAAGKSAVLDAIRVGLLGHDPRLGGRPGDVLKLGPKIKIRLDFDQGFVERVFAKGANGVEFAPPATDGEIVPPVMFDARAFLALSSRKRVEYLFDRVAIQDRDGLAVEGVLVALKALKTETKEAEAVVREICEDLENRDADRRETGQSFADMLAGFAEGLKTQASESAAAVKMYSGKASADARLRATDGLKVARPEAEALLSMALDAMTAAQADAALKRGKADAALADLGRAVELKCLLAGADGRAAKLAEADAKVAEAQAAIAAATSASNLATVERIRLYRDRLAVLARDLEKMKAEAFGACNARQSHADAAKDLARLEAEFKAIGDHDVAAANRKAVEANAEDWKAKSRLAEAKDILAKLEGERAAFQGAAQCPFCLACGEGWKMKADAEWARKIDAAKAGLAVMEEAARTAAQEAQAACAGAAEAEDRNRRAVDLALTCDALRRRIEDAKRIPGFDMEPEEVVRRMNAAKDEAADLQIRLLDAEAQAANLPNVQALRHELDQAKERQRTAKAAVDFDANLQGQLDAIRNPDITRTDELEAEAKAALASVEDAKRKVDALRVEVRAAAENAQEEKRRLQAKVEMEDRQTRLDVLKMATKTVAQCQADLANRIVGRFVAKAHELTGKILGTPLELRDGEVGRYRNGEWVAWETFSGTEEALTFAGLSLALADAAPLRLVVMDEMGRFDETNKKKILGRMFDLVAAGKIDQFFGVDVDPGFYASMWGSPGFTLATI